MFFFLSTIASQQRKIQVHRGHGLWPPHTLCFWPIVALLGVYISVRLWTDIVAVTASQQCKRQSQSCTGMWLRRPNNIETVNMV